MNLISVGLLESKGFYLNNRKKVLENGQNFIKVVRLGDLYYVEGKPSTRQINLQIGTENNTSGKPATIDKTVDRANWQLLPKVFELQPSC